jgi:hypothetical protein
VAVIRDELKKIGVTVDVVTLEGLALIERFARTRQYEAVYFTVSKTDTDPARQPGFLGRATAARTSGISRRRHRPPSGSAASTS